jgi:hypothetical protein
MMTLESERLAVIRMVEEGKVTAEEGARLLGALGGKKPPAGPPAPRPAGRPRWLRVRVTDVASGRTKASVNIPVGLVSWGLSIGAQFAPQVNDYDLNELTEMLESGYQGKLIDVLDDEDGEHVEIYVD